MSLIYEGRCWMLGDDVSSDELISARHVFDYDPEVLRRHLLAGFKPELATEARPGDILFAGRRFAHGSQHTHPFIAMKAMGLGLVATTLLRPPFRLAIYSGVPLLEISQDILNLFNDGDRVQVDFRSGVLRNLTRGHDAQTSPLPDFLLQIVEAGGGLGYLGATRSHADSTEP